MTLIATPVLGRRRFLLGGMAAAGGLVLPTALKAQTAGLVPTPRQTAGPFYPERFPPDVDNDLVVLRGSDARGRYLHPGDSGGRPRDAAFQGYGRARADLKGRYSFRTIRPVPYPGRTPHIHFAVQAPGRRDLVTQMYVAGEPQNEQDGLYRSLRGAAERAAVTVRLEPATGLEPGALGGSFDLVLA